MPTRQTIIVITIILSICVMNCIGKKVEITSDEINISNIPKISICKRTFEIPKNEEYEKALNSALSLADNEISIVQYMMNNGLLKWTYVRGLYMANKNQLNANYSFGSCKKGQFGQVNKKVFKDKIGGKRDLSKEICIIYYDTTNIVKSFDYGNLETTKYLEFYPSGRLKHCGIALSNKYYRGYWDENGNLINEIVKIKDWAKERILAEERTAKYKKRSDERIQAGKNYMEKHPELNKISHKITEIFKQLETIHKKLESDSYQEQEIASMKAEQKVLNDKLKELFSEFKKLQKQIIEEEKGK